MTRVDRLSLSELTQTDSAVLALVRERQDAMLQRTLDWARINTGSWNADGLGQFAPLLGDVMREMGMQVELAQTPPIKTVADDGSSDAFQTGPVVLGVMRPEAPVQVVLTGHYDTVFPDGTFTEIKQLDDNRINGPGTADMKGGIVVMLEALRAFDAGPDRDKLGYRIVLSPDEETGNFASADFITRAATGAHIGMTYEPAMETGQLAGARKGSAVIDVVLRGKASHAGRAYFEGRSAIYAAADLATRIEKLNENDSGVTFNVGTIDGGNAVNIVPEIAVVRLGARAPDGASADWAMKALEAELDTVLQRDGITGEVHGGFYRPPKPRNAAQADLFGAVAETGRALNLEIEFVDTGGVCEGNNVFAAGVPNIDTLGVRGGLIHSHDEFFCVDSLAERAGLSALILNRLADGRIDAAAIKAKMKG